VPGPTTQKQKGQETLPFLVPLATNRALAALVSPEPLPEFGGADKGLDHVRFHKVAVK